MKIILSIIIGIFLSSCANEAQQNITQNASSKDSTETMSKRIDINLILGKFKPETDADFVLIDIKHADREGLYLHKETYEAFAKMFDAAKKDGITLIIKSATRNFDYQKRLWENKWNGTTLVGGQDLSKTMINPEERALKILEYSSMPGSSRHHWGTDLDLNNFENNWFESGEGLKLFLWLEENAEKFGFCRPYTTKGENRPNGYNEEKWHWSYMPLARPYIQFAKLNLKDEMIVGFDGAEAATKIGVVEKYVLGINKECL